MEITIQPSPKPLCSLDQAIKYRKKNIFRIYIYKHYFSQVGIQCSNFFFGLKNTGTGTKSQTYIDRLNLQSMDLLLYQEHYLLKNTQLWKRPGNV